MHSDDCGPIPRYPDLDWWVMLYVVKDFLEFINVSCTRLQGKDILIQHQEKIYLQLCESLENYGAPNDNIRKLFGIHNDKDDAKLRTKLFWCDSDRGDKDDNESEDNNDDDDDDDDDDESSGGDDSEADSDDDNGDDGGASNKTDVDEDYNVSMLIEKIDRTSVGERIDLIRNGNFVEEIAAMNVPFRVKCKSSMFSQKWAKQKYGDEWNIKYESGWAYGRYYEKKAKEWRWKVDFDDDTSLSALESTLHLTLPVKEFAHDFAFEVKIREVSQYYDRDSRVRPFDSLKPQQRRLVVLASRFLFRRTAMGLRKRLDSGSLTGDAIRKSGYGNPVKVFPREIEVSILDHKDKDPFGTQNNEVYKNLNLFLESGIFTKEKRAVVKSQFKYLESMILNDNRRFKSLAYNDEGT